MIENRSYSLKELKDLVNTLHLPIEVSLFKDADFNSNNPKILLIQSDVDEYTGHYVLVYENNGIVYFFDPSASKPLQIFKQYHLDQNNQDITPFYNYLSNKNIDYNNHNYQSKNSKICGLMCIVRYLYNDLDTDKFYKYIKIIKKKYGLNNMDDTFIGILNTILGN